MEITKEIVREFFHYDPRDGELIWKKRGPEWFSSTGGFKMWNTRFPGKKAGRVTKSKYGYKYKQVGILGRIYQYHRVVWMWMSDDPVPDQIDHINQDTMDNRWENLRPSSPALNTKNKGMYSNNKSGVSGVCWHKRVKRWQAGCRVSGKQHHIGYFDDLDQAKDALREFRASMGFSGIHGSAK